jgi:hypothetical protein
LPFVTHAGGRVVVNPGSLGQPKHGVVRACHAVWEDGRLELRSHEYPVEETVRKVLALPVPDGVRRALADVLLSSG